MARRKNYRETDFPVPGMVYAMPLADGKVGVCRILRVGTDMGSPAVLVAVSPWIDWKAPCLNSPEIRKTLKLNHHRWHGQREVIWIVEPPPNTFRELGQIKLSKGDLQADSGIIGYWDSLSYQVLAQWRWDNDRDAVMAEDAEKANEEAREQSSREEERQQYLSKVTLDDLVVKTLFPQWADYPLPPVREGTIRVVRELIEKLRREKTLTPDLARPHLESCVRELNSLDRLHQGFIETEEREDLYEVFEEILSAAKVPELLLDIDGWRNW